MKLIFVLILIVGIMAWFLMPTKPQNSTSPNQSSVQTNSKTSTPPSTGKAIWDGKLTVDVNTADELLDRPHNELSVEEVALKWQVSVEIAAKTKNLTKHLECLTDQARQRTVDNTKKYGINKMLDDSVMLTYTAVKSVETGSSAKVLLVLSNPLKPKKDGTRVGYIYNLYKTKRGWVTDMSLDELATDRPIKINGKYYARFLFSVSPDGTIARAIPIEKDSKTGKRITSSSVDLTDQHVKVDDLMESLFK